MGITARSLKLENDEDSDVIEGTTDEAGDKAGDDIEQAASEDPMSDFGSDVLAQLEEEDVQEEDEELVATPQHERPQDQTATIADNIFADILQAINDHETTGDGIRCLMCNSEHCNGIKNDSNNQPCPDRRSISRATWRFICYGCGGQHNGNVCKFRSTQRAPSVPPGIERCFNCFLPQHAQGRSSFHSSDDRTSGSSNHCRRRGKVIFGLLTAASHMDAKTMAQFIARWSYVFAEDMPVVSASDNGTEFRNWWQWLWHFSTLRHGVLHIDLVLTFLLAKLYGLS